MRAAKLNDRPAFALMKQNDIQSIYYMQMPRWLFSDARYAEMSLDAKVAYTFLLNRFQLSRRKGWANERGEVFVIFPRKALAQELRVCEKRITAAIRQLMEKELVWEKRCGRGDANQVYLARVEPEHDPAYQCAPFVDEDTALDDGYRTADMEVFDDSAAALPEEEAQNRRFKNGENSGSRTADMAAPEPPILPPSKKEKRNKDLSQKEVSQSVSTACAQERTDRRTDAEIEEEELMDILDACELYIFPPETAKVFENAVERLFYSDSVRLGNATLPQRRVRAKLHQLDGIILQSVDGKLAANLEQNIKNSTAYTMTTILNAIAESESDLMVDPYLNGLRARR